MQSIKYVIIDGNIVVIVAQIMHYSIIFINLRFFATNCINDSTNPKKDNLICSTNTSKFLYVEGIQ